MPQLDPDTFSPQLIWLAITFIGLYFVMARMALPRIGNAIEHRRDRIAHDLDQAQALKEATDRAIASYEERMAQARSNAHAMSQETRQKLKDEVDGERARIDAELAAKVAAAEKRIAKVKVTALDDMQKVAGDLAGDIVAQLIGAKVTGAQAAKAVEQAREGKER
jgi:F-type H+-transporting ATPase subunit b